MQSDRWNRLRLRRAYIEFIAVPLEQSRSEMLLWHSENSILSWETRTRQREREIRKSLKQIHWLVPCNLYRNFSILRHRRHQCVCRSTETKKSETINKNNMYIESKSDRRFKLKYTHDGNALCRWHHRSLFFFSFSFLFKNSSKQCTNN